MNVDICPFCCLSVIYFCNKMDQKIEIEGEKKG